MDFTADILTNPAIQAVAVKVITSVLEGRLKDLDGSDAADKYSGYLKGAAYVMTAIVAFVTLALQHQAANFDSQPFVQYLVTLFTASYAANHMPATGKKG